MRQLLRLYVLSGGGSTLELICSCQEARSSASRCWTCVVLRNVRNLCAQKDMHSGMLTVKPATKQTLRQQLVALRRSVLALHLGQQLVHVNLERSALYNTISKHRDPEHELLAGCNQHMQQLRSNMLPTMTTCDMSLAEPCAPPPVRPSVRPCVRLSVRPCVRLSVSLRLCAFLTRIKPPGRLGRSGCESRQRCLQS